VPSKSKPLSARELAAHEAKRDLAADLLQSIQEMREGKVRVAFSLAAETDVMENEPELAITADVAALLGPAVEEEFRRSFPGLQIQQEVFKAAEGPSSFQLVADFITWSTVFKVAATAFLSQLAKNAADDLWQHKAELAAKLREKLVQPLHFLSSTIAGLNRQLASRRKNIQIGLPSDACWGTVVRIDSADEVEVAWMLAHFILQAEAIYRTVAKLTAEGHSGNPYFELHLTPVGEWAVTWRDDADEQHEHRVS
jgi:hypothetical protein